MLIVLEGLDGAGKSTQVRLLKEYLSSLGGNFDYIHFPRYEASVYGEMISRFLRGEFGEIDDVHPRMVAFLFALDRKDAAARIRETLDKGGIVLLDRYVYSNIAYQCAKTDDSEELAKWIKELEYGSFQLPKPDLNLFLDVPVGFVESNLSAARQGSDRDYLNSGKDIHESSIAFQSRVRNIYLRQIELDSDFIRVDCSDEDGNILPQDAIAAKVKAFVDNTLFAKK